MNRTWTKYAHRSFLPVRIRRGRVADQTGLYLRDMPGTIACSKYGTRLRSSLLQPMYFTAWVAGNKDCPTSQMPRDESSFEVVPAFVKDKVDGLKVFCPVNQCQVERRVPKDHIFKCLRPCFQDCGNSIMQADADAHLERCDS